MHRQEKLQRQHEQLLAHRWISNPLDWAQIDRLILLSGMVMLVPLFFGISIICGLNWSPEWLSAGVAKTLLLFHAAYLGAMLVFVAAAFRRRRHHATWARFEDFIIYSYVAVVFVQSWLSGTHLTGGMLLLMIGAYLTSALADIRKVMRAFVIVVIGFVVLGIIESSGHFRYAPVFARPPYNADGSPVSGWFAIQMMQIAALLMITYVGMIATKRWVERENLFREMSTIDGLTRLTNRRSFIERSESEFERARRASLKGISCIMIDIDHFKRINDTLGHPAGDAVLVQTAGLLLDSARPYDEVGRYGGEEFAVLLPETTLEVATLVAERLRQKIAEHEIVVGRKRVRVTASFGVACFPGEGIETINDLLKAADKALYEAKFGGRNRVVASIEKTKGRRAAGRGNATGAKRKAKPVRRK
ncbi:GGDEF domain-containing protein [Turneriella parva]|uniref:diguanylate cyclase n=1 Tax=Turneriella parva (strain ATCC BAA-1111 / DSM 21527 / NCTC 11395 / H) TaxID=869212 RepID=I4B5H9_TURPD|nr:GGDEF domain-containing protein [Turneriella parva]AFM12536.1 diguanylate cyclase [Turneriella parva DSM 21527]